MMQKITPFLWFNDNAEEAVNFYTSVFDDSRIEKVSVYDEASAAASGKSAGSVMTVLFYLYDQEFVALNGGPAFKLNPSVSFFVYGKTEKEVEELWQNLSTGGKILMPLDKYPFSEKYGWAEDKFGVSWQVMLATGEMEQYIIPSLMFTENSGKAEEAINFYTTVFKNSNPGNFFRYEDGQAPDKDSKIAYADFSLEGQKFAAMDGGHMHDFSFNEAVSFVVKCQDQSEIDYYWQKLSAFPQSEMCGWCKDRYGISWQIVPTILNKYLTDKDVNKSQTVMKAMLGMKKIVIAGLEKAYNGN